MEDTTIEAALKTFQAQYAIGDYPNALLTLKNNQKSFQDGVWHYNLGTVLAKMNDLPLARYHFLMAEFKGFAGKELDQAKLVLGEQLELTKWEKPMEVTDYAFKGALIGSQGLFTMLSLILLVFTIVAIKKRVSLLQISLLLLLTSLPLMADKWVENWRIGVALKSLSLQEAPSAIFGSRGEIPPGVMIITSQKEGWEKVIYPSRYSGWIKSIDYKLLELK